MKIREIVFRTPIKSQHNLSTLHPVLQTVMLNRNVTELSKIELAKNNLLTYIDLKGIEEASSIIYNSILNNDNIVIVGDYDVDGATSTALCLKFFYAIGYSNINFIVPNRIKDGYGLTTTIVNNIKHLKPNLLITVDNGISSIDGVAYAKQNNMKVIITDHHLPGELLPNADAIVNPNQPGCKFASKNLAGVGVAFYVLCALRATLRNKGFFTHNNIQEPNMLRYLDLVALGTVADVVPLDYNNRILVQNGINQIRKKNCATGILALCAVAKRNPLSIVSSDFGFALAPRLNAAGRLDDMTIGIKCLLATKYDEAVILAEQLDTLNHQRKDIEYNIKQQAIDDFDVKMSKQKVFPDGICLYDDNWHEGVIGIVASRVKDRYNRPTIIFTATADQSELKGSARSIPGIHIKDILENISSKRPELIIKFGGHAMAAGLSIPYDQFAEFNDMFLKCLDGKLTPEMKQESTLVDCSLDSNLIDLKLTRELYYGGPWGQGFPEPCFHGVFTVVDMYVLANKHIKFTLKDNARMFTGIAFHVGEKATDNYTDQQLNLIYKLNINDFFAEEQVQLLIEQFTIAE